MVMENVPTKGCPLIEGGAHPSSRVKKNRANKNPQDEVSQLTVTVNVPYADATMEDKEPRENDYSKHWLGHVVSSMVIVLFSGICARILLSESSAEASADFVKMTPPLAVLVGACRGAVNIHLGKDKKES